MINRSVIIILFTFLFQLFAQADEVEFTASAPRVVELGENFRLIYTVNASGSDLKVPPFEGFNLLSGPNTSQSSSIQIINGQMTRSVTYTYTYILQAAREGRFTFEPASIKVNQKTYQSNPVTIEVVKGSKPAPQQRSSQQTSPGQAKVSGKDLFVSLVVDKKSVYQGEPIVAIIKVYTRLNLVGFDDIKFPSFNGFWSQDIENPTQISLQRENVGGAIYNAGLFKKMLLFPQKSGEIIIESFELECVVQQRVTNRSRGIFDDFFGSYQNVKKRVVSEPVKIRVKDLPENAPDAFAGAVGSFSFNASIDKSEVVTNDAVNLKFSISGKGNLKLLEIPEIDFPLDFETYDPKISQNIKNTVQGASGSKTFEYLIIPRHAGTYRIPSVTFAYFDPASRTYRKLKSQEFTIKVNKGNEDQAVSVTSSFSKEDVKFIGSDIRFIKTGSIILKRSGNFIFGTPTFYFGYLIVFVVFTIIFIVSREKIRQNANVKLMKHKKASKFSRKRLKTAYSFLKQEKKEDFYAEVLKALWGYLSDKLGIPVADLSKENLMEALNAKQIEDSMQKLFFDLVDTCEYAQYAPVSSESEMDKVYKEAGTIIGKLEQKLR